MSQQELPGTKQQFQMFWLLIVQIFFINRKELIVLCVITCLSLLKSRFVFLKKCYKREICDFSNVNISVLNDELFLFD